MPRKILDYIGEIDMKKSIINLVLIVFFMIQPDFVFSEPKEIKKGGFSKELFEIPISKVKTDYEFGNLIDVYYPSEILPCFVFVFKKGNSIVEVMANSENKEYKRLDEMNLDKYISLGFIKVTNLKTQKQDGFFFTGKDKQFKYLNNINPYTSIAEIENKLDMELIKIDKGGFLFPFYTFIYQKNNHVLEIICSPNEDKNKCYFTGGWTYH